MSKQELAIAKKIAEIEGVKSPTFRMPFDEYIGRHYNPFDWSILGPLMIKYKVTVNLVGSYYCAQVAYNGVGTCENNSLGYSPSLPCAILECIIKSQEE